jgi:tetratricopeptide (TPR) repeat protein
LSLGLEIRGSQETIAGVTRSSFTCDGGLLFAPLKGLKLGAVLANAGWGPVGDSPASALSLGASYQALLDPSSGLLWAFSGTFGSNATQSLQGGLEFSYLSKYFLRAGYQGFLSNNAIDGLSGLALGAGIQLAGFTLDYAYLPYGNLGDSHRFSISYPFDAGGTPAPSTDPASPLLGNAPKPLDSAYSPNPGKNKNSGEGVDKNHLIVQFELPTGLFIKAQEAESKGLNQQALSLYQEVVTKDPKDMEAWWALGNLHYRLGHRQESLGCFGEILKIQPDNKPLSDWLEKYKAQAP